MNPENKKNLLKFAPRVVFLIFILILMFYSSSLSIKYKKNEETRRMAEELEKKEIEKRIYLTGKFDPSEREDFILIPAENTFGANNMYLRKETYEAFMQMRQAAKKDGVNLKIASATRNFDYQKIIWDQKWAELNISEQKDTPGSSDELRRFKKILEFNATPGTSRHHWGTDLDINRINPLYAGSAQDGMIREEIYAWLVKNAAQFGFCQTYTPKGPARKTGYNEERWHWSYTPLAKIFTQEYKNLIKNEDIKGFLGDEFVSAYDLVNNYVLSINPDCL